MDDLLADLTEPQREAVMHTEGPLLILAAAGSGKTRVITRRIAHLIGLGIPAWSICALTFTNKAAGEMRERVEALLTSTGQEHRLRGLTAMTFHALCARLLRRYADIASLPGLNPDYSIYDSADQTAAVKKVIANLNLSTKNWPPASVKAAISRAKNELQDAEAFEANAIDFASRTIAKIYKGYQTTLRRANAIDFDDLLLLTAKMLRDNQEVRQACRDRWQYLMIDEYQDTNHAQFLIASLLAGDGGQTGPNICVVGDPDQAIYSWRGADISNILEFEDLYPKARVIALGENFRSSASILEAADALIKKNTQRKDKPLFTSRSGGGKPTVVLCRDERHESELVADWLTRLAEDGMPWKDMAVFYRTNALSRVIEDALRGAAIPYTIARGTAFYEREEVKNALGYLRVVANPADDVALARVINTPPRGIGKTTLTRIIDQATQRQVPVFEVMRSVTTVSGLTARATTAVNKFVAMIDAWTGTGSFLGKTVPTSLHELVERVNRESGLERHYSARAHTSGLASDEQRLENLAELISSAKAFEDEYDIAGDPAIDTDFVPDFGLDDDPQDGQGNPSGPAAPPLLAMLRAYLESVALVADADAIDPEQGAVTLMTLHAAKGLEFPAVAIIGLEQGLLPHSRAASSADDLEEERRLAFVGITRAMRELHMTSARYRTIRGISERMIPSQFITEIGTNRVVYSDQAGLDEPAYESRSQSAHRGGWSAPITRPRPDSAAAALPVGCTVRHPQFGLGKVLSVQSGANARARIRFAQVGEKTLVLEYARLTRVDGS